MFGYVKINKSQLSATDYEHYRGVYCSLCRALGRRYGPLARLLLNYDMTFFALLALSLAPGEFRAGRCGVNPFRRCNYCHGNEAALHLAADVSMAMAYYKWRDKCEDSGPLTRLLWAMPGLFFCWAGQRAKRNAPHAWRIIYIAVTAQRLVEVQPLGLDAYAHPSAHALAELCALLDPRFRRLGYLLGRWVYLADAADDQADDLRRGHFNAFAASGSDPKQSLHATAAALARALEPLEFTRFGSIIVNILTMGI